jgi:hypothetical protein
MKWKELYSTLSRCYENWIEIIVYKGIEISLSHKIW